MPSLPPHLVAESDWVQVSDRLPVHTQSPVFCGIGNRVRTCFSKNFAGLSNTIDGRNKCIFI